MNPFDALELRRARLRLPGFPTPVHLHRPPSVDALLERLDPADPDAEQRIPYWAELWPSAVGLAAWLAAGGGPRRPGRALELGCGLGLAGLVALRLGWDLELADRDPEACAVAEANLRLNGLDPRRVRCLDWNDPPPVRYDTVLGADLLYERAFAEPLVRWLDAALNARGRALLVEPGRAVGAACVDALAARFAVSERRLRARVDDRWRPLRLVTLRRP